VRPDASLFSLMRSDATVRPDASLFSLDASLFSLMRPDAVREIIFALEVLH